MTKRSGLKGSSILLVEDEMLVAMLLESVLEQEGCKVISAGFVEQATRLATEQAIDAAILDVNLHGKRSYPVADALSARGIPFLFATGYGDVDLKTLFPDNLVIAKPFDPDEVITALTSLIAGAAGSR